MSNPQKTALKKELYTWESIRLITEDLIYMIVSHDEDPQDIELFLDKCNKKIIKLKEELKNVH